MGGSLNKVQLIGYLGLTPKAISTKDGSVFYSASIALSLKTNQLSRSGIASLRVSGYK